MNSYNLQDGQALALPAGTNGGPRPALQVWHREPNSGAWTRFSERASRFLLQSAGSGARECHLEEDNGRQVQALSARAVASCLFAYKSQFPGVGICALPSSSYAEAPKVFAAITPAFEMRV